MAGDTVNRLQRIATMPLLAAGMLVVLGYFLGATIGAVYERLSK